jgi:DUF4097 and DUF4098 domain-containing protein YvlB
MMMTFAVSLLAAMAVQSGDTTVQVRPGSRLELDNIDGNVTITTWNRGAVRIEATSGDPDDWEVEASGSLVNVRGRRGPADVDFRITVPVTMTLNLTSQSGEISVDGVKGQISVETVEGSVTVKGGTDLVSLHSVDGSISLTGARGRVDLNTVDGDITATDITGSIRAGTVDGAVRLNQIESADIDANTVDGDIEYTGTIQEHGRYRLASHDGNVTLTVPRINATVSVSTFSGSLESDFPVTLSGAKPGKRMTFTLGSGSARIELESFDGLVRLRRAGGTR